MLLSIFWAFFSCVLGFIYLVFRLIISIIFDLYFFVQHKATTAELPKELKEDILLKYLENFLFRQIYYLNVFKNFWIIQCVNHQQIKAERSKRFCTYS